MRATSRCLGGDEALRRSKTYTAALFVSAIARWRARSAPPLRSEPGTTAARDPALLGSLQGPRPQPESSSEAVRNGGRRLRGRASLCALLSPAAISVPPAKSQ